MSQSTGAQGPLAGVRVIDLTAMVMGPYATQIMADMGAEVIKIEPPAGDTTRYISVAPEEGMSGVFANVNRGKKSVVLDLRSESGKTGLQRLLTTADVFIHSMRAKAIEQLGFAYEAVAQIKPDIVYTNCYGYGAAGRDRDLPAYDDTIQAECGMIAAQELLTGSPDFAGTIIADKVAGLTALYGTLMALFHRQRTGEGQAVEAAMLESMAAFMLVEHANGALFDPPLSTAAYPRVIAHNRKPYKTRDGYIAVLVYNDKHWRAFIDAVAPSWHRAGDMDTVAQRAPQIDRIYALLAETFAQRSTDEWLALLRALEIPCAPLKTLDDLFTNPHLEEAGFWQEVESPWGAMRMPGIPTTLSKTPGRIRAAAPRLGEHTDAVLSDLAGLD